jgi:hypothetical protein
MPSYISNWYSGGEKHDHLEKIKAVLDAAITHGLIFEWLDGFIGEVKAGTDPVEAAWMAAAEWDF